MMIVDCRKWLLAAAMFAASAAYGQQATDANQATPQDAQQGQAADQQQDLQDQQSTTAEAQQSQLDQPQSSQLEPPQRSQQQGRMRHPGAHDEAIMRGAQGQPGEGMTGEGQPGVLGVLIIESAGPGVVIREVLEGSAAEAAGIEPGDVILAINGDGVDAPPQVTQMIRGIPAGETANLRIWRDGAEQDIAATLQAAQRSPYRVGFRGGDALSASSDLAARTERLEAQLATVMQELQRLRQDVMRLRAGNAGQDTGATGIEAQPGQPATGLEQPDRLQPGLGEPDAAPPAQETPAEPEEETPAEPEATEPEPALPF